MRTEFGYQRTVCDCSTCKTNCRFIPGYLIPSDLPRMIPTDTSDVAKWAEANLLASPGAVVMIRGQIVNIPTLVPATKLDGSCIHYNNGQCKVWEQSPFGCAFFDCKQSREFGNSLSSYGLYEILRDSQMHPPSLYRVIWEHLHSMGLVSPPSSEKVKRLKEALNIK